MNGQSRTTTGSRLARLLPALLLAMSSMFVIAGCEDQGPAEEAGESIDETAEDTRDAVDDATD